MPTPVIPFTPLPVRPYRIQPRIRVARRAEWAGITIITLLAAALRGLGLDSQLWWDEIYTLVETIRPPLHQLVTVFPGDNQHPLYSVLAHGAIGLFGESAWSVRLPAFVFGVACVPALFLLGTLVASRAEALLAALFLAVSYHHVWFSQNARGYTALCLAAILSTYLLIRGLREVRLSLLIGYAVVAALGIYTHLTMVFLVAAQGLVCVVYVVGRGGRTLARYVGVALACGAAVTLLLYAPILSQVVAFFLERPSTLRGVSTPGWALSEAIRVLRVGFGGATWVLLVGAVVLGFGVYCYVRESRLVAALFLLPGVITLAGALAARGTMYPRFFFYLAGFAVLILLRGATALGARLGARLAPRRPAQGRRVGFAAAGACVVVAGLFALPANYRLPKQDFVGAMEFVEASRAAGDHVAAVGVAGYPYTRFYGRAWPQIDTPAELEALADRGGAVWLVYTFPRYLENGRSGLTTALRVGCPPVRTFPGTVGGGDVVVCRIASPARRVAQRGDSRRATPTDPASIR